MDLSWNLELGGHNFTGTITPKMARRLITCAAHTYEPGLHLQVVGGLTNNVHRSLTKVKGITGMFLI